MTEELEREAEEYADEKCKDCYMCSYSECKNPYKICQRRKDRKQAYVDSAEPREKRIAELEAQIEKMKCCFNCKHSRTEYEHCKTDKHEKWEIKEKCQ